MANFTLFIVLEKLLIHRDQTLNVCLAGRQRASADILLHSIPEVFCSQEENPQLWRKMLVRLQKSQDRGGNISKAHFS